MGENVLLLERRLEDLERNLLGGRGAEEKVLTVMQEVHGTIDNFARNRERFNQVFKRVPAIDTYLTPGFLDKIAHDPDCEMQFILAVGDDIRAMSKQLEEINVLTKVLDSEAIQDVPRHGDRLKRLALVQDEQLSQLLLLDPGLGDLLTSYNRTCEVASEIFTKLEWDLCQIEEKNKT